MQHFYVEPGAVSGNNIYITGEDYNHIRNVLRMKPGEKLTVVDGESTEYSCEVAGYSEGTVECMVLESRKSAKESSAGLVLFQGIPKKDKLELIVQKAVELGVSRIVPVITKRVIAVPKNKEKDEKHTERLNAIALAAAKQCGRGIVPEVTCSVSFEKALEMSRQLDANLIPYELAEDFSATKEAIRGLKGKKSIGIFIGPEGGFEASEVERAMQAGAVPVTLGKRILRTETAGFYILSVINYEINDQ